MARTADKIDSLISEDGSMEDALAVVLDRTEGGTEEIEWSDVSDELSSGQWGRLIEKGVLVDGDIGFELSDPDGIRAALNGDPVDSDSTGSSADTPEGTTWSTWDKLAGLASLGLFAGYSMPQVRNTIGRALDVALGPVDQLLPFYVVVMILAILTGLYSTLLMDNLMDMDKMSAYQQRMKDIQERRKEAKERGDDEAMERIQEEQMDAMGDQLGMFKEQFRPMVWTMFLTIPVFLWMYWMIRENHIALAEQFITAPLVGEVQWTDGVLGPMQMWIIWYFVCSMGFTQLIRKSLNIQTTPT